jgi:SMC interacting uncharacterized protein involved in chromosome segregation
MTSREDKEERETQRAIEDLARSMKKIKKKNWDGYKDIYPALYAQEFGIDRSISPQIQKIVDRAQEKTDNTLEENRRLKEDIKGLKSIVRKRDRELDKMDKEIEKKNKEIEKLREVPIKTKRNTKQD